MGDDRFSHLNRAFGLAGHMLDEELDWDLPDDHIAVPAHLLPAYQDEDDESILPSQAHPSYPYGNPYKPNLLHSPSRRSRPTSHHPSSFVPSGPSTFTASLSTTLPSLELRDLFARTTFGEPADRQWTELHLGGLFGRKTRKEQEEDEEERDAMHNAHGDAGPPAGQNAGDAQEESEGEEGEGEEGIGEGGSQDGREAME
ncbi:hypothetical protein JCM8547_006431 [Rhodosporidiobolus lusitaniae]